MLENEAISAIGLCLTVTNSNIQCYQTNKKGWRKKGWSNKRIATELKKEIEKLSKNNKILTIPYVLERHRSGIPHLHCIIFVENIFYDLMVQYLCNKYGEKSITTEALELGYMWKTTSNDERMNSNDIKEAELFQIEKGKRFDTSRIAGVQSEKKLHFAVNEKNYMLHSKKIEKINSYVFNHFQSTKKYWKDRVKPSKNGNISNDEYVLQTERTKTIILPPKTTQNQTNEQELKKEIKARKKALAKLKNKEKQEIKEYKCNIDGKEFIRWFAPAGLSKKEKKKINARIRKNKQYAKIISAFFIKTKENNNKKKHKENPNYRYFTKFERILFQILTQEVQNVEKPPE